MPDYEFLPPASEIVQTPLSPVRLALLWIVCALFAIAFTFAWVSKVDIYAVAVGRVQPVGRSKLVQPEGSGSILAIYVKDGTHVSAGQLLVELDPTEAVADQQSSAGQVASLAAEIIRRKAAITIAMADHLSIVPTLAFPKEIGPPLREREQRVLGADIAKLRTGYDLENSKIAEDAVKRKGLIESIEAHRQTMATLKARVDMRQTLAQQGWDSRSNVIDATETFDKENTDYVQAMNDLRSTDAEIATLRHQMKDDIAHFIADNAEALETAENKYDQSTQDLVKTSEKLHDKRLVAPITGTVQELGVTTIGQVVSPGQQLMTIVPDRASLQVEALVQNQDIGFVKLGQPVVVKVDAFPYTRYGTIEGHVGSISRDAIDRAEAQQNEDTQKMPLAADDSAAAPMPKTQNLVYSVLISLDRNEMLVDGTSVALTPGMSVTTEIKTGQRRVIDYLLSPLREVASETAHER